MEAPWGGDSIGQTDDVGQRVAQRVAVVRLSIGQLLEVLGMGDLAGM